MEQKQLTEISYETPVTKIQSYYTEGVLCMSNGSGTNESYEDSENEYNFTFTM